MFFFVFLQGCNYLNLGFNVEILDFIGVILSNQNVVEYYVLFCWFFVFLQVVIQIGDVLSGDGLCLQYYGCLQGVGFYGVVFIVVVVDVDDDYIVMVGCFQCCNCVKGYWFVVIDDVFYVGVCLQDVVYDVFVVDQGVFGILFCYVDYIWILVNDLMERFRMGDVVIIGEVVGQFGVFVFFCYFFDEDVGDFRVGLEVIVGNLFQCYIINWNFVVN